MGAYGAFGLFIVIIFLLLTRVIVLLSTFDGSAFTRFAFIIIDQLLLLLVVIDGLPYDEVASIHDFVSSVTGFKGIKGGEGGGETKSREREKMKGREKREREEKKEDGEKKGRSEDEERSRKEMRMDWVTENPGQLWLVWHGHVDASRSHLQSTIRYYIYIDVDYNYF